MLIELLIYNEYDICKKLTCHEKECLRRLRSKRFFCHHKRTKMTMLGIFIEKMRSLTRKIGLADVGEKKLQNTTN